MSDLLFSLRGLVFVLVLLGLDAWAIRKTYASDASRRRKLGWSAVVLLLPLLGLVIWSLAGPRVPKPEVYEHEPP